MILRRVTSRKDEKGDLITDSHRVLDRWRNHFFVFEVEMATGKVKRHKSPGSDQILVELIKAGIEQLALRSANLLILCGIRRNCPRSRSLYLFIRRGIKQIVVIIGAYHFYQLHTKFYPTSCCQG